MSCSGTNRAQIDAAAYADQIAWLKSQGLLKDNIRIDDLIDKRYAKLAAGK